jgi:hypothetical protein
MRLSWAIASRRRSRHLTADGMTSYQPEQWHDFFVTVGGGAAALTGLAVVALSMHVQAVTTDPVLRHRARMILVGLGGSFMRCSLALMGGQDGRAVAVDLFVVCLGVTILGWFSYWPIAKTPTAHRSSLLRTNGRTSCYGVEMLGAVLLFCGTSWGLTMAATAMVANFFFMISGCWLLLLRVRQDETPSA